MNRRLEADRGADPYWRSEFAYTCGELPARPRARSGAAGFLRLLADGVGREVLRCHGHRPRSELAKPLLCRPA